MTNLKLHVDRARSYYDIAEGAVDAFKGVRSWWRKIHNYTVSIASNDDAYSDIQEWLLEHVPESQQKALAAFTGKGPRSLLDDDERKTVLYLAYDAIQTQTITIEGHKVTVTLDKGDSGSTRSTPDTLLFRCQNSTAQRALVETLRAVVSHKKTERAPSIHLMASWGGWERNFELIPRPAESVVLRAGQLEALIDDVNTFRSSESDYLRRGLPYHRGYLFQGPPGTGKTSVARVLATHFNLDLYYAPLGDVNKDTNLLKMLAEVRPNSVLLLEDVDVYQASTTREGAEGQVTLAGLLNGLDGVGTPHGLITILTSNNPESLDKALVRPGRIDRVLDLDFVTQEQAIRHFTYFYGTAPTTSWLVAPKTSTADLTEIFKRNMEDPMTAESEIPRKRARRAA